MAQVGWSHRWFGGWRALGAATAAGRGPRAHRSWRRLLAGLLVVGTIPLVSVGWAEEPPVIGYAPTPDGWCFASKVDSGTCSSIYAYRDAADLLFEALGSAAKEAWASNRPPPADAPSPSTLAIWKAARLGMTRRDGTEVLAAAWQLMQLPDGPARAWEKWRNLPKGCDLEALAEVMAFAIGYGDWDEDGRADFASLESEFVAPWTSPLYALAVAEAPTPVAARVAGLAPALQAAAAARVRFRQALFAAEPLHRAVVQRLMREKVCFEDYCWGLAGRAVLAWVDRHPLDADAPELAALGLAKERFDWSLSLRVIESNRIAAARGGTEAQRQALAGLEDPPNNLSHDEFQRHVQLWIDTWFEPGPWASKWHNRPDLLSRRDNALELILAWQFVTKLEKYHGVWTVELAQQWRSELEKQAIRYPGSRWRAVGLAYIASRLPEHRQCCTPRSLNAPFPSCAVERLQACSQLHTAASLFGDAWKLFSATQPGPLTQSSWRYLYHPPDAALFAAEFQGDWLFALGTELGIPAAQVPPRSKWQSEVAALQAEPTPTAIPAAPLDPRVQAWLDNVDRATVATIASGESKSNTDRQRELLWQAVLVYLRTGHVAAAVDRLQLLSDRFKAPAATKLLQVLRPLVLGNSP